LIKSQINTLFLILFGLILSSRSWSMSVADDMTSRKYYKSKCLEIKAYTIGSEYSVECNLNYQFFNSKSESKYYSHSKAIGYGKVRIASYNMLHPGSLRSGFKDYSLLAKIINNWDLVAGLELLPVLGRDNRVNDSIVSFLNSAPGLLKELKTKLASISQDIESEEIYLLEKTRLEREIQKLNSLFKSTENLYRAPGYIKILKALRKLDPSWSLLLAPKGEAAEVNHVHEFVGFFFRGSRVRPIANEHCSEYKGKKGGSEIACIPNLRKSFMGIDTTEVFSRRPFLASFKSGNFDFSMVTSHVVYGSPDNLETMKKILMPSFGVSGYEDIGIGVTKQTYARWAEAKIILKLIENLRDQYYEQDIIYGGDMNLEAKNKYFKTLLREFPGQELFIHKETTISQPRYHNQGVPTKGLSRNFDHFIFDKEISHECLTSDNKNTTKVYPYYSGMVDSFINKNYKVRDDKFFDMNEFFSDLKGHEIEDKNEYVLLPNAENKIKKAQLAYRKKLQKLKKISSNTIVPDEYRLEERVSLFKQRVFTDQLTDQYFYRMYLELLSDHMPISMSCRNKLSDDDE
jgi:hypothetical protein